MAGPSNPNSNEPYGFSISYSVSVDNLITILTGWKRISKKLPDGSPVPNEYEEVEVPNSYPVLTREGGKRVRSILEMNMDKFNPIGKMKDRDCAHAAAGAMRSLADTITLNADVYLYDYDKDPTRKLVDWNAYLENLMDGLYRFATLARDGHFITFAGKIMSAGYEPGAIPEQPRGLRALFSRPRKNEMTDPNMYG